MSEKASACHALAVINYNLTVVAGAVQVNASSTNPTCGCDVYWLDVEIRCVGEAFDAGPFDPTQYLSLSNYPYFQSATMLKPQCQVQAYPTTTIPYANLCPGTQYQVRVRENNNGNGGPWSNALTFTVPGALAPLVGTVNAANVNLCIGDCTNLTASVIGGCDLASTYSWNTGQNTPTINVCPTVTTTYTVTITDQCSNLQTVESITVFVVPTPIAGVAVANPPTVCVGETTNLTLTGFDGNIQWQSAPNAGGPWTNIGGATTDNEISPPINSDMCFRAAVSGCGPTAISNVVCVTVAPTPILTVTNETICDGETTTLTTTANPAGGTYLWTPSNQTTPNLTNVSPNVTTAYDVEYTLNGCTVTETGTVTVNPQPTTLALVGSTICDGDNATITAIPDVPGGTFTWTPNVSNNNTAIVTPGVGTNTYTIDYAINGCVYSESVDIVVNPSPTVAIADQGICAGEQATLTAVPDFPGGTFVWGPGGEVTAAINVSPAATTIYDVTYTLNGCVATDNATLTVNPMPVATFNYDNVCEDNLTTLTSTSNVALPSVIQDYEWDILDNGSVEYTVPSGTHDFNGFGNYSVSLTVTTDAGCSTTALEQVEVYPLPIIDFTATPLCLGSPTDFNDLTIVPNGGAVTNWTWDFADGNGDVIQNPSHTYAGPGVYPVNLAVVTDNGCVGNITSDIEIYAMPVANFNVDNECFYDALNFNNVSVGNATIFNWNFGDGNTSNQENPSHTYAAAGQYNVTFDISTADGCADQIIIPVTAYPQPNAEFTVDPTCLETNSVFVDMSGINPVAGDVINQWQWDFGNGNTSSIQNPSIIYGNENIFNASLTVTTNFGCVDTYTSPVTVWPLPSVNFSPTDVCLETVTQFNDLSTISNTNSANNNAGWDWDFGDGGTSNQQNPNYTYNTDGQFNATLIVTSNNGCTSENTLAVTVHPNPVVSFTGENLSGCSPVCFTLNSTSVINNPSQIVDYTWTLSNGATYSSTTPVISDCFNNNTSNSIFIGVELTATSSQGCSTSYFEPSFIEIYHNPTASFTFTPENPDVYDATVDFINTSSFADNYNWNISGYGTSNDFSPVADFPLEPATYDVELIATTNEGCADTAYAVVDVLDRIIFYVPNTFTPDFDTYNQYFTPVFTSGFDPFDYNLLIFNRYGEVIFESNDASIGWDGTYGASSNEYVKDGTYIWKIEFKETMSDKRHVHHGHVNILR